MSNVELRLVETKMVGLQWSDEHINAINPVYEARHFHAMK